MAIMKTEVKVAGTDISNNGTARLLKWVLKEDFGDEIREAEIVCTKNIFTDIPTLENGNAVTIKRGFTTPTDQFVFNGIIDKIKKKGPTISLYLKDAMTTLIGKSVNYSYDGINFPSTESKGSDIAESLIETHGGMTAVVVDTGSALTIDRFICNNTDIFSRLKVLADIYDYMIYYDSDDDSVHFEPKGTITSSNTLYIGNSNNNCSNIPEWVYDNENCINKITVRGAAQEVQDEEYFSGTGAADQSFVLAKKPIVVQVWQDATLKAPGVDNSTEGDYDYTIDKENFTITPTDNWTPGAGSDNIKIVYTNAIPAPVTVDDEESQVKYGTREATRYFDDVQTVEDSLSRGQGWLTKYSEPFVSATIIPVSLIDYDPGQIVPVIDVVNDEEREIMITSIHKSYPHRGDKIIVGDKTVRLADWGVFTLERIRRLEEKNARDSDITVTVKSISTGHNYDYRKRYSDVYTKVIDGTGLIWGHPVQGIWSESGMVWSADSLDSEVLIRRNQGRNVYKELFYDEDFKNGSTTATWDTSTRELRFT